MSEGKITPKKILREKKSCPSCFHTGTCRLPGTVFLDKYFVKSYSDTFVQCVVTILVQPYIEKGKVNQGAQEEGLLVRVSGHASKADMSPINMCSKHNTRRY